VIARLLSRAKPPPTYPVAMPMVWPTDSYGLSYCSEAEALDLPVVSAALELLCSLCLQMPLGAVSNGVEVTTTPIILRNPAPGPGRVYADWICETVRDLALHGNAVAVLGDVGSTGWPTTLYPVPHGQWSVRPDGAYLIGSELYPPVDIFHVRRNCRTGDMVGMGLMEMHPRLLASAIAAERFAADYFSSGIAPPTIVTHPDPELTAERAALLKDRFRAATRHREAVVVPTGTTITPLSSDADGAQMSESRRWNSQQIALSLGVPPALLGLDSPSMTYRNLGEVYRQYISSTLMSYLVPLEDQLSGQCLPRNMTARFDTRAVLRPDIEARVDIAVKALDAGLMTREEARSVIDLPPELGAPDAFAPSTDIPLTLVPPEEVGA
jgi:HK97 family phage portal protein